MKLIGTYKCNRCGNDIKLVCNDIRSQSKDTVGLFNVHIQKNDELVIDINDHVGDGILLTDFRCPVCNKTVIIDINKIEY